MTEYEEIFGGFDHNGELQPVFVKNPYSNISFLFESLNSCKNR